MPINDGRALVAAEMKIREGKRLSDRGLDKAQTLASVAAPFDAVPDVLDAILSAEEAGMQTYQDTREAMIYRAVKVLHRASVTLDGVPTITLRDIHETIWHDLIDNEGYTQRQLEMKDPVLPEFLGPKVRSLGFRTDRGEAGIRIRDPNLKDRLEALAWKYEAR